MKPPRAPGSTYILTPYASVVPASRVVPDDFSRSATCDAAASPHAGHCGGLNRDVRSDEGGVHHGEAPVTLGRLALLALKLEQDDRRKVTREARRLISKLTTPLVALIGTNHAALSLSTRRHGRGSGR